MTTGFRLGARTIFAWVMVGVMFLTMFSFGLDVVRNDRQQAAIEVNDAKISYQDVYKQREDLERRHRSFLGKNFDLFARNMNFTQQVVDTTVANLVLRQRAEALGYSRGRDQVAGFVRRSFEQGGGFSPEAYEQYLSTSGTTAQAFEEKLADDLLVQQFTAPLEAASQASLLEARLAFERAETKVSATFVEFDPAKEVTNMKDPPEADLQGYFAHVQADYEIPAAVRYDYVVISPTSVEAEVQVAAEDVDLEYTDNPSRYTAPARLKLRQIRLTFPEKSDAKKLADLKEKAESVRGKLLAGEPFEKLVKQHSDDVASKVLGGDIGWYERGKFPLAVDNALFKLNVDEISEVQDLGSGYAIFKLTAKEEPKLRPMEEVRSQIETMLRKREAPAYAAAKAQDLFDSWTKGQSSLADFAKERSLTLATSGEVLEKGKEPRPELAGLTAQVLDLAGDKQQLVELRDESVLVDVTELREARYPELAEVKTRVVEAWKVKESKNVAKANAEAFLTAAKAGAGKTLKDLATARKLTPTEQKDMTTSGGAGGPFGDPKLREALFSQAKPQQLLPEAYGVGGKYYVVEVGAISPPSEDDVKKRGDQFREQESRALAQLLIESVTRAEKARANIKVADALFADSRRAEPVADEGMAFY